MSSAKGNVKKSGPPKHQNKSAFRNSLHDTSKRTKVINSIEVTSCCSRCTEIIEWKIKYKKYKMLTIPKKCIKCEQKAVKQAYTVICDSCAVKLNTCAKCGKKDEIVNQPVLTSAEQAASDSQLQQELKQMSERKRRAFHRMGAQDKVYDGAGPSGEIDVKEKIDNGDTSSTDGTDSEEEKVETRMDNLTVMREEIQETVTEKPDVKELNDMKQAKLVDPN